MSTWEPELSHLHNTAANDCSEIHRQRVLKIDEKQLNVKSQGSLKRSRRPRLLYHADVFHLCLLCSPTFRTLHLWSRLSARLPPLSPLRFTLSVDTPPLLPLSLCFTGGGGPSLPPAPTITQNLLSIVPFDFFQMCHVLTSISPTFHYQTVRLLFFLPPVSPLVSLWLMNTILHLWSFHCPHSGHSHAWRFIITISHPHTYPSLPSSLKHGLISHFSIAWIPENSIHKFHS